MSDKGIVNMNDVGLHGTVGKVLPKVEFKFVNETFEKMTDLTEVERIKSEYLKTASPGSAGIDLRYIGDERIVVPPQGEILIHTGLAVHINDPEMVGVVAPRSGLGSKDGLVIGNLVGIIDSDYQGELLVSLWNRREMGVGSAVVIVPGDRIVQFMIVPRVVADYQLVEEFSCGTERGGNGFGSSGSK